MRMVNPLPSIPASRTLAKVLDKVSETAAWQQIVPSARPTRKTPGELILRGR